MRGVEGVVAWARFRLTNASLEGNNSRVRGLGQRAHGYRTLATSRSCSITRPGSARGVIARMRDERLGW